MMAQAKKKTASGNELQRCIALHIGAESRLRESEMLVEPMIYGQDKSTKFGSF